MNAPQKTIPPECGPTLERIQSVLDRIHPASILMADSHPAACAACRERVRAAQAIIAAFAEPRTVTVPARFADSILESVKKDRLLRLRRRSYGFMAGIAAVIAVLAIVFTGPKDRNVVKQEPGMPLVPPGPAPAPTPPIRVNDQLAKASDAIRESSRTITEPVGSVASLTDTLFKAPTVPMGIDLGPAGRSLSEIPDAAKAGLEPVTNTAQKAFDRMLRDVTAIQPKAKS